MDALTPTQWIAHCALKLHERWHTVETGQLEEVAVDIWKNQSLRAMAPEDAAALWLSPITSAEDAPGQEH